MALKSKPTETVYPTAQTEPIRLKKSLKRQLLSPQMLVLLFALGLLAAFASRWLPLLWDSDQLVMALHQLGPWAIVIFLCLHVVATVVSIPGIVLTMVGGICFGLFWGSLWSLIGATLGAIAAFSLSRYWMRGWFDRRWSQKGVFKSLNRMVRDRPFWFMLTIRFAPISPFNIVNFLLGLTHISLLPYASGTFFGILPGVIVYTWVGKAGYMALHGESWIPLLLAGSVLAVLSTIPLIIQKRKPA